MDYEILERIGEAGSVLPSLESVRQKSMVFTNAFAPANDTIVSVPSIIHGEKFAAALPISESILLMKGGKNGVVQFGSGSNLFSVLQSKKNQIAIIGWYFPYQRIFGDVADIIYSTSSLDYNYFGEELSIATKARNIIFDILPFEKRKRHLGSFSNMEKSLDCALDSDRYQLIFCHFPLPHLPKATADSFDISVESAMQKYLFNLNLADEMLGRVIRKLESMPPVRDALVIITSDHHFRKKRYPFNLSDKRVPLFLWRMREPRSQIITNSFNSKDLGIIVNQFLDEGSVWRPNSANEILYHNN
jgi:hypothetical protein